MKILILIIILNVNSVFAQASGKDPLTEIKVSKEEILQSLDSLKKSGRISEEEYLQTKKVLLGMDQNQIENINNKAKTTIKTNPKEAQTIFESLEKDLNNVSK
jgi:hypothetical protein